VGGSATIVTSPNGTTWTPTQVSGAASSGYGIIFTGIASNGTDIYIVGKERGVLVYGTSPIGSWSVSSSTSLLGSSDQERHIAYGNNRWLVAVRRTTGAQSLLYEINSTSSATAGATGSSGFIATRGGKPSRIRFINGNFWLVTGGNTVSSIADNGRIYNLGSNPNIDNDYSSNAMTPAGTTSLWDIEAYGNNGIMVFGDNGTSLYTTNNTTWQTIDGKPNTNTDLRSGALASDNTLVIAGNEVRFTRYYVPEVVIGGGSGEVVVTDGYWYLVGGESEAVTGDISWNEILNKPNIPVGANLTEQAAVFGQSARSGVLDTFARSDHYHALPSAPSVPSGANIDASPLNQTVTHGSAQTWARSDHRHAIPTIPPAQIQSDWNQSTNTALDYIKNKPTIPAAHSGQSLNFRVGSSANQLSFDTNDSTTKSFRLNAGSNVTLTVGGDSTNREVTIASTAGGGGSSVADLSGQGTPIFGQNAVNGTASTAARSDHVHALPASPSVPTGANLSSQASNFGQAAQNGSAATFARSDHYHALPAAPTLSSLGGESAISAGTTDQFWRGDKSWQAFNSILPVYGTSSTSASTTAKTSTITGFVRRTGSIVGISFTNANTASAPTLNVNSTGAANIQYNGSAPASGMLAATTVHIFQFDGTSWQLLNPVVTSGGSSIPTPSNSNLILRSIAVSSVIGYNWDKLNLDLDVKNTLPIANGGTGSNTAASALANLGGIGDRITTYATSSTNFDNIITSGVYSVYGSSSSSNHSPSTSITGNNAWNLLVIGGNNGVIQIASPAATSGGTVYYRVGGGSSSTSFPTTWQTLSSGGGGVSVANLSGQASAFGQAANSGSAATAARSDHYHALPPAPTPFWSEANTGGDVANVTTPGAYSGNWSSGQPSGASWGSLLVLASDTGTSYRQKIFIQESSNKIWFQSNGQTWKELTGGSGGIPEPSDSLTYGRYNGGWRRAVNLAGDTMTGILNIERSVATATESNRYFQLKTTTPSSGYNTLDGMRFGVSNISGTCGGWIQSFNGSYEGGQLTLNPNGGKVETGGGFEVKGSLSVATSIESQNLYVKNTARFGNILPTARRVEMTGNDGFAIRGATGDARSILIYRGEIFFFMDSNADFDSTAAGFRFALEGTSSAPTLTVKKKAQNGSWTNAVFSNGAFS
jgi:hypothetical protein